MDRAEIQCQLALAEERVRRGIKCAERQRAGVERLERQGLSTGRAKGILGTLDASLRRRQARRDRLLADLERVLRRQLPETEGSAAQGAGDEGCMQPPRVACRFYAPHSRASSMSSKRSARA